MRILLVDDDESVRITLAANLELEGYEVVEATDGEDAIEKLGGKPVDLVVSDVRMPKLGGVRLMQHVKQHFPSIPVVLMTAYAVEEQVQTAIDEGVFTVLRKPFEIDPAIRTMVRALQGPVVLIVDDDDADAKKLAEGLRRVGLRADAVSSGESAIRAIRSGTVDVCVLDLVMPDVGGVELVQNVLALDPNLVVILLSAYDAREMIHRASASGVFACLEKPVSPRELLHTVAKARGGRSAI
jgi:DNA-binding NtrC family response regulator